LEQLETKLDKLQQQEREAIKSSNLFYQMQSDVENEKAVLMGNKESVIFIYMVNCVICVLFLIQGILMWRAAKPTV